MHIKIWGARGSIAAPLTNSEYQEKIKMVLERAVSQKQIDDVDAFIKELPDNMKNIYGGNTTCVSILSEAKENFIIDCGTGIRELGRELMKGDCGVGKGQLNIMLTHNHWDHIQGLPFFDPLYVQGNKLTFFSLYRNQEELLERYTSPPFFPVTINSTVSEKKFQLLYYTDQTPLEFAGGLQIDFCRLNHPNGSTAYRFKENGKTFIFATDVEFRQEDVDVLDDKDVFFKNADVLILDAQYTRAESSRKVSWGHTSIPMAVNCATKWDVKTLVLTHHDPGASENKLILNHIEALEHAESIGNKKLQILMAQEGMTFEL